MGKKNQMVGGFAYRNLGRLENCFAAVRVGKRKHENAGFVYDNRGSVSHCFTRSRTRRWKQSQQNDDMKMDGFCSFCSGTISESFFLVKKDKHLEDYRDSELGLTTEQADCQLLQERFDWDFTVFEEKEASKMDFLEENWNYPLPDETTKVLIRSEKELTDIIDRINRGDPKAVNGWYELDSDLNFHGKEIPPIGPDYEHPFEGVFDGKGHIIRGFVLKGRDRTRLGLFGHLNGTVANLRADGIVKGKSCQMTAAFCAVNKGEIHCCEAVSEIHAKHYAGLFVGENYGLIERCSVSGKSHGLFLLWLFPLLPLLALLTVFIFNPPVPPPDYEPITEDRSIIPNPDNEPGNRSNENKASYEIPKVIEVEADTLTASNEQYVIKNPSRGANYNFVATIYMTDTSGQQVEVYKSGSIPVGYHIKNLTLTPPDGMTLAAGSYDAEIVFSFYHQDSGEKGMIDSRVPLTIHIR